MIEPEPVPISSTNKTNSTAVPDAEIVGRKRGLREPPRPTAVRIGRSIIRTGSPSSQPQPLTGPAMDPGSSEFSVSHGNENAQKKADSLV